MYQRIILKLSGEMLGGESGKGWDLEQIESLCSQVCEVSNMGVQTAVVIGGGNIMRGEKAAQETGRLHRATADYMGMLATVMNALALGDTMDKAGLIARVMSAIAIERVVDHR